MLSNQRPQKQKASYRSYLRVTGLMILMGHAGLSFALSSDRDQPAVIEADEVEFDFNTGERTYIGNVIVIQGTLHITGDKMVVKYNGEELEKATAWGNPATFKQRPDDKDEDVIGKGRKMILDETANTLTLIDKASLKQGPDTAKGQTIIYDMSTDKMVVKGGRTEKKPDAGATGTDAGQDDGPAVTPGRSRVIITPRQTTE